MKNYIGLLLALLIVSNLSAQDQKDTSLDKLIMKQALAYGDENIAASSLYAIIAKEGANSTYKDSLAYLYFSSRKFSSCFMVCTDLISRDGNKIDIIEMQAVSLENLGAIDKAAQVYAKLVSKTNDNFHAYKLASLYLNLKKYDEAYRAIIKAQELKDLGLVKVTYAVNKNYSQQVSLLAAISNMKGLIEFEQDKLDLAKTSFEKAVSLQGDFVLAKENLEAVINGKNVKKQ